MIQNHLNKEDNEQSSSYGNWPSFISLLKQNLEGEISCIHHPLKGWSLSFPTRLFTKHLGPIWSSNQAKNWNSALQGEI